MDVSRNKLRGSIPSFIYSLTRLRKSLRSGINESALPLIQFVLCIGNISLAHNLMSGSIAADVGQSNLGKYRCAD